MTAPHDVSRSAGRIAIVAPTFQTDKLHALLLAGKAATLELARESSRLADLTSNPSDGPWVLIARCQR